MSSFWGTQQGGECCVSLAQRQGKTTPQEHLRYTYYPENVLKDAYYLKWPCKKMGS